MTRKPNSELREEARAAALAALAAFYGSPDATPEQHSRNERAARHAVADALAYHESPLELARQAKVRALTLLNLVDDDAAWIDGWRNDFHQTELYLQRLREAGARYARARLDSGVKKDHIAKELGISRPTLDAWLKKEAENAR